MFFSINNKIIPESFVWFRDFSYLCIAKITCAVRDAADNSRLFLYPDFGNSITT